ncbi:hypothetical protein J5N97_018028 [Dioscorea zingiberensis]|uniref:H/ACA ribonucleoprotein complex non-core subunit NAF1 n=1 Tax=Dioscorea zingiberensis TaxID=325984 RepID=A0A9D5CM51_9LILI|nr:hypothetical protein J5N97_018028 [Dioscorea zingiberensis]
MVGWRIPNNKEASCPTFFDSVLDFDPVVEWLVDPDLSPMSISNAGDVKVDQSEGIPAVHEPRADESELSESRIDEKMDITLNPVIIGGGEAVAGPDERIMKMEPLEVVLGSEPMNSTQEKGSDSVGNGEAGSELGDVKMEQSEDIPAVHVPRADESELLRSPIDEKMDKFTLNPEIIGGGEAVAGSDVNEPLEVALGSEPMNSTQEKVSDSEGDGGAGSESESEEESSTEESSSSSSDEEVGDDGGDLVVEVEEGEIMEDLIFSSEDEGIVAKGPIKSKNEIEDLPPVPRVEVCLELHHQTSPVGVISSIMGNRVIVEGSEKHNPLSEGSILWITETRSPLGMVDEIFGPVKNPYYIVRYNSDTEVPGGVKEGTKVSFVLEFANHVLNDKDVYKKGYDASGENDEEITGEVEFSDDEKEAEYRKSLQQTKRATGNGEFAGNKKRNDRRSAKNKKNVRTPNFHARTATDRSSPAVSGSAHESSGMSSSGCSNRALASGGGAFPMIPSIPQAVQPASHLNHPSDQPLQHLPGSVWPHTLPLQQQLIPSQQQLNVWPNDTLPQQQLGAWALGVLLQQQQQQNALAQGFPPLQQLIGVQGGLSGPPYQHLQNPGLNAYPPMPSQQQFGPNSGAPLGEPWINRPFNLLVNPMATGPFGQTGFGPAQVGSGNAQYPGVSGFLEGQNLAAIGQAGQRPQGFAPGRSSPHGRRPHGRGGRHSFGRGNRPRSG